jgi:hypothetical protein
MDCAPEQAFSVTPLINHITNVKFTRRISLCADDVLEHIVFPARLYSVWINAQK